MIMSSELWNGKFDEVKKSVLMEIFNSFSEFSLNFSVNLIFLYQKILN